MSAYSREQKENSMKSAKSKQKSKGLESLHDISGIVKSPEDIHEERDLIKLTKDIEQHELNSKGSRHKAGVNDIGEVVRQAKTKTMMVDKQQNL